MSKKKRDFALNYTIINNDEIYLLMNKDVAIGLSGFSE